MTAVLLLIAWLPLAEFGGTEQGTAAFLRLESVVSTETARPGDPVRLRTVGPMTIGTIAIPTGSEVRGRVSHVKRPGRVKGRGELEIAAVAIALPDGTTVPVTATSPVITQPRRRLDPRVGPPSPVIPILAGMLAGYGTAALVSQYSNDADTIVNSGVVIGLTTGVLVGVLKRGEDLVLQPGRSIEVVFGRAPSLPR